MNEEIPDLLMRKLRTRVTQMAELRPEPITVEGRGSSLHGILPREPGKPYLSPFLDLSPTCYELAFGVSVGSPWPPI